MFTPVTIPFGAKILSNTVKLKTGVKMEDVELASGDICTDSKKLGCDMQWQGVPE